MSLKTVHGILQKIKNTSSTLLKEEILRESLQEETFKKVIVLAYDDSLHYKVKTLPSRKTCKPSPLLDDKPSNEELFAYLEKLAEQRGTSNDDKMKLGKLASMDEETYEVVKMIINKDCKGGFSGKTINKAYPGLIMLMPYCRCSTAKTKEHTFNYAEGLIEQEKADGMFVNIIFDEKYSVMRTRNGNQVYQLDHLENFFKKADKCFTNTVYMGELLIQVNGKILPRKTGNGILNSCLQGTADESARNAIVKLWDAVPINDFWKGKCDIPYKNRLTRVTKFIQAMNDPKLLSLIDTRLVYSKKESARFYQEMRAKGKEGTIGKKQNMKWAFNTSVDAIKHKNVDVAEMRIVSWRYGKEGTKYENCMGSIQCETEDKLVQVSLSGFTDAERLENWDEKVGKICSVFYESVISSESREKIKSLYLPQFDEMRPDRSYADTLEDLETR